MELSRDRIVINIVENINKTEEVREKNESKTKQKGDYLVSLILSVLLVSFKRFFCFQFVFSIKRILEIIICTE